MTACCEENGLAKILRIFNQIAKLFQGSLKSASLWAILGTGLRVGGGLITLPLALRSLPQAEMGLYYTFLSITGLAVLLDFGFGPTVVRNASYAAGGARDFKRKGIPSISEDSAPNGLLLARLAKAMGYWYQILGTVLVILLFTLGSWFILDLIARSKISHALIYCWLLFALGTAFGFSISFWQSLLVGIGEVRLAAIIGFIIQVIALVVTIVGLSLNFGIWSYAFGVMTTAVLGFALFRKFFRRITRIDQHSIAFRDCASVFHALWPMAWRQGVVMLGAFLIQRGNTLICSIKLGLDETASYGLSLTLLAIIFQVSSIPLQMSLPKINQLRVSGNIPEIRRIFFLRLYSGLAVAAAGVLTLCLFGNTLLGFIGSKTHLLPSVPFVVLGVVWWLETHHSQYGVLVLSENENPFIAPALISGFSIVILSWFAAGFWGVIGLILAQGVVQLCWNNWWTVLRGLAGVKPQLSRI